MKAKLISKYIVVLMLASASISCGDFVDVVPDNLAVIEDSFETRDQAERFLVSLYGFLPSYASINNPALAAGDEIVVNDNQSRLWPARAIQRGGQTPVIPELAYWGNLETVSNLFIPLRDCNIFLENADKPFDLLEDEKVRWIAEAKFLKAYYHFYLLRMYGPIPIIRENIEVGAGVDVVRVSRDPVDEVAAYIIELLDEAIPNLPVFIDDTEQLGRVTSVIGAALKAKVLITMASPLFNGNSDYSSFVDANGVELISTTYDESKWSDAAIACKEAIDLAHSMGSVLYKFPDAPSRWADTTEIELSIRGSVTERWNDELIWGASGSQASTIQSWAQAKIDPGLTVETRESVQSFWSPPLRIAELFYSNNGVPIDEDVNYDYESRYDVTAADDAHDRYVRSGFETASLNLNREPRFYASLGFDGGRWFGHGLIDDDNAYVVEAKKGERAGVLDANNWSSSGYFAKKLVYYENLQQTGSSGYTRRNYPFPVIRLADLYLLYAEALNESGQTGQAYEWIDMVRERAGLNGVVASWSASSNNPAKPLSQDGLRDIIHDERMIELVFEGQRFWDLRRWKRAVELLNSPIRGWNVQGESTEDYYKVVSFGNFQFLSRDYLWPISEIDIITNTNLIQNPGW